MKLDFNTVFILVGGLVSLFAIMMVILSVPGAQKTKEQSS
jgi:hypothetical protein